MSIDPTKRRLYVGSALILVAVFVTGAVAGGGLHAWLRPGGRHHLPRGPGGIPPHLRELNLTPEQQEKAKTIFERERTAVEAVIHEGFPRIRAAREQADRELRTVLTPAQATQLDEIRARHPIPQGPRGFHHDGPPGPPPPGPPPPGDPQPPR